MGGTMADPARLTVSRTSDEDVQDRQVILTLDGARWTSLLFGQSAAREVAPGRHHLTADNTLFRKSVDFEAAAGEELRFAVASRKGPLTGVFLLVGAPFYHVTLRRA
jgi:hypothetical protein